MGRCLGRLVKVGIYQHKHDKKGHLMGDEWKGKPLGEFTDDDRAAFMAELNAHTTPSERASLREFATTMRNIADFAQSDEAKEMGEQVGILLQAAREVATGLKDELEQDTDLARELQGMSLDEAIESGKLDALFSRIGQQGDYKPTPRALAADIGAIMTLEGHLAAYTSDDLKDALTSKNIFKLPANLGDVSKAFDEQGRLNPLAIDDKSLESVEDVHAAFLMAIAAMVETSSDWEDEHKKTLTFYIPKVLSELGIDPRPFSKERTRTPDGDAPNMADLRFKAAIELITPFELHVGRMPNKQLYRLLAFDSYDPNSETMTIATPYLFSVKRYKERLKGPQLHKYLRGSVANESNHAAVELANRIIVGVARRGTSANKADQPRRKPAPEKYTGESFVSAADYYESKEDRRLAREHARAALKRAIDLADDKGRDRALKKLADFEADVTREDYEFAHPLVVYKPYYNTLLADCPMLANELAAIEADRSNPHRWQAYNAKLKNTFEVAFRIIAEKSELPAHYRDFQLPTTTKVVTVRRKGKATKERREVYVTPTKSVLSRSMVITHRGKIRG